MTNIVENKIIRKKGRNFKLSTSEEYYLELLSALNQAFIAHLHFDARQDTVKNLRLQFEPAYELIAKLLSVANPVSIQPKQLSGLAHTCNTYAGYLAIEVVYSFEKEGKTYQQNITASIYVTDRKPLIMEIIETNGGDYRQAAAEINAL